MQAMTARAKRKSPRRARGFTLLEIAISLALLGVLAIGILVPLVSQLQQRNTSMTEKTLSDIKDALVGYAAINGRLPCPATLTGVPSGAETFAASGGEANGQCSSFWGYVPALTLGITPIDSSGFALDAWNNRIRYAVSKVQICAATTPAVPSFTSLAGLRTATLPEISKATALLTVCDSGIGATATACNATARTLTTTAAVVIWSPGPNALTGGGSGLDEKQNPNPKDESSADVVFVSRSVSDIPGNVFDDVVSWLSINTLVNRMVAAGQLP
jgi:prepilin-type N-terminal cleavage/methylation domain-containing protein